MRVLHICSDYFLSQLYENMFTALHAIGITSKVFTLSTGERCYSSNRSSNIIVLERKFTVLERLVFFGKQKQILQKICTEFTLSEFSVIHAHTLFSAGFPAYVLSKKFGIPYIVVIRNTDVNVFFRFMFHLRSLGRKIISNSQYIIFLSPTYRDFVLDKYIPKKEKLSIFEKSLIIPNGIDKYFIDNKHLAKRRINNHRIKLIYIGEINSNKNIETTIKVCKLLFKKGYLVKYTVVGEILETKYKKIISSHSFIDYHPFCIKEEVVIFLRDSDIFVMPSIFESFGLVYAEAMSQGLPVIYSKGQGFDKQFEDGVIGYAVNSFDYKYICNKILDLYANYDQFSERCLTLVEKFNWKLIAKEYKQLYMYSYK
jgi:glycosyltransferase involved in cell wall biosynthesis